MPSPLSAIDAVSPAFEQTKRQLFKPFRFHHWVRLAVVSLVTGEFAGGGVWGGGNFSLPSGGGKRPNDFFSLASPAWERVQEFLPWILLGVFVVVALVLLWLYVASVYRFILFDAVLNNRCELREGWRHWKPQGSSYFLWIIAFGLAMPVVIVVVIGSPIFFAWRAGVFSQPKEHLVLLVVGGVALFFLLMALIFVGAVAALFAKDFAVPLMALEDVGILEAWRLLLPMLGAEKLAYTGYVLMKIVLAAGCAILFGIINLLVLLALLIPLGIGGVALYFLAKAAGLTWNIATISLVVVLAGAALMGLLYVVAFVSSPAMVFFQSYTLHFFGSRYPQLGTLVFRTPPSPPASPTVAPSTAS